MEKLLFRKKILVVLVLFACAGSLAAASPLQVIRYSNQKVLNILSRHAKVDDAVEAKLMKVIDRYTSFAMLSRSVVSRFKNKLSAAQLKKFDNVFQTLLRVSSIKKTGRYRAKRFKYLGQRYLSRTSAVVRTVAYYKSDDINLDYVLKRVGGRWVIVNYTADDIDTARNYRKQFRRLFRRKSFNGIIDILQRRIKKYRNQRN